MLRFVIVVAMAFSVVIAAFPSSAKDQPRLSELEAHAKRAAPKSDAAKKVAADKAAAKKADSEWEAQYYAARQLFLVREGKLDKDDYGEQLQ